MLVNWFYEGVFRSVVERGSGVFVSVVLMGVRTCPAVTLGYPDLGWVGGTWPQPPRDLSYSCKVTVNVGEVGVRGFLPVHPAVADMSVSKCLVLFPLVFSRTSVWYNPRVLCIS